MTHRPLTWLTFSPHCRTLFSQKRTDWPAFYVRTFLLYLSHQVSFSFSILIMSIIHLLVLMTNLFSFFCITTNFPFPGFLIFEPVRRHLTWFLPTFCFTLWPLPILTSRLLSPIRSLQLHDDKIFFKFFDWLQKLTENKTGMYCCLCVCMFHAVRRTTP